MWNSKDHYRVLDLPSGKEGTKLSEKQIKEAYKRKALQLHPDKRPDDPNANEKFQRLQSSYATLMDPHARKVFDASLLIRLNNKPSSSSKPKKQSSSSSSSFRPKPQSSSSPSSDKPKEKISDILKKEAYDILYKTAGMCCYMLLVLGPTQVPIWVTAAVYAGICLAFGTGIVIYAYCIPDPNQGRSRRYHEDIEDWVMV